MERNKTKLHRIKKVPNKELGSFILTNVSESRLLYFFLTRRSLKNVPRPFSSRQADVIEEKRNWCLTLLFERAMIVWTRTSTPDLPVPPTFDFLDIPLLRQLFPRV
ncbi:hypothetical protein TNIN_167731 [Trichonephila inaurata madagascariensis]|uniref:Uncharacterized protein n=1 Tax=Trichonephila inaurata madagascariensis TaxID=2747483 RepID=A0A8X6YKL5_9ARAC|nr:hypothetical protein TNIN_167731 [Trichonephila inaurata madagascariensis]